MLAILMSLISGIFFGFILQKGGVSKFNVIVNQFLLKDFTVALIIIYAIIFGAVLFYGTKFTIAPLFNFAFALPQRASSLYASGLGGLIFGVGMAIYGYCPGTGIAALAQGSIDALFGIFGMVFGVMIFEKFYLYFVNIMTSNVTSISLVDIISNKFLFFLILGIFLVVVDRLSVFLKRNNLLK